jgi:hypothetical protein
MRSFDPEKGAAPNLTEEEFRAGKAAVAAYHVGIENRVLAGRRRAKRAAKKRRLAAV